MEEVLVNLRDVSAEIKTMNSRFEEYLSYLQSDETDQREAYFLMKERLDKSMQELCELTDTNPAVEREQSDVSIDAKQQ